VVVEQDTEAEWVPEDLEVEDTEVEWVLEDTEVQWAEELGMVEPQPETTTVAVPLGWALERIAWHAELDVEMVVARAMGPCPMSVVVRGNTFRKQRTNTLDVAVISMWFDLAGTSLA